MEETLDKNELISLLKLEENHSKFVILAEPINEEKSVVKFKDKKYVIVPTISKPEKYILSAEKMMMAIKLSDYRKSPDYKTFFGAVPIKRLQDIETNKLLNL